MADQGYGTPDWVNPANTTPAVVSDANVDAGVTAATGGQNGQGSIRGKNACLLAGLSLMNMGLAAMMTALGVLTILSIHNGTSSTCAEGEEDCTINKTMTGGFSEPFLAFYMILFAILLFLYEFMYWTPLEKLNENMRKNFGFMYGLRGKGFYLIFVGCLCFGLGKEMSVRILNYFTGISWLLGGCLHVFITFSKPEVALEYIPPGSRKSAELPVQDDNVV